MYNYVYTNINIYIKTNLRGKVFYAQHIINNFIDIMKNYKRYVKIL